MKKKWIWIGIALVLAAAGIIGALLLLSPGNTDSGATEATEPKVPDLYRNLDSALYNRKDNPRPLGEDGLYHLRFALNGKLVELTAKDEKLVRYIDSLEVLGLTLDENGKVVNAFPAEELAQLLCVDSYVQSIKGDRLYTNTSLTMNGIARDMGLTESTRICNVSQGSVEPLEVSSLLPLDEITVYGDENGNATHIFVDSRPTESRLYRRTAQNYSSKTKETTREPDENGVYHVDFYCEGSTVTLPCKDKAVVTAIDAADGSYFGLTLDGDGNISGIVNAALGLRGVYVCSAYDVTELNGSSITAVNLLSGKNETWNGTLAENCRIFDVSKAAYSEGRQGQQVEGLQIGDRVSVFTDTENRAIEIYISTHLVDCPIFFSTTRKYSSTTKETTRKPDAEGWYTVSILKEGDSKAGIYKTKDKALMTYLDSTASRCVGVIADENNVIQRVYHPECLFGQTAWSNGGVVASTAGPIINRIAYGKPNTVYNGVMMPDCKVFNASTTGQYGALTTLQAGDYIYAFRQPTGELVRIYVVRRCLGADTLYYNLNRRYDSDKKETTRTPDSQGFYTFALAHNGKRVTLKTDNKELANALDAQEACAVSLLVEDGIILEVNAPNYACGGSQVSHGDKYVGLNQKGSHVTADADGKETTFRTAADCAIYNVKGGSVSAVDSIPTDAIVTVYTNRNGEAQVIFIRG